MRIVESIVCIVMLCGCEREERQLRLDPPTAAALDKIALMPNEIGGAPPEVYFALDQPYEVNAYNLSQGKRLYSWFGCKACHGDGQGGIGPCVPRRLVELRSRRWSRSSPRSAMAGRTACQHSRTR